MVRLKQIYNCATIKVSEKMGVFVLDREQNVIRVLDQQKIIDGVQNFQLSQNEILFTNSELDDLSIADQNGVNHVKLSGYYYLSFFHDIGTHYALVKNDSVDALTNSVVLIDKKAKSVLPFKSFRLHYQEKFITTSKDQIILFNKEVSEEEKLSLTDILKWSNEKARITRDFIAAVGECVLVSIDDGSVIGVNTNNLKSWVLERAGRLTIYNDLLYSISDQVIREVNVETGDILRSQNIKDLENQHHFFPTGEHKVYEDYIFIMSAGKPGRVAIYNRKNLEFQSMIVLDELIPLGKNHLYWYQEKLYILDFGNTLHVYENIIA